MSRSPGRLIINTVNAQYLPNGKAYRPMNLPSTKTRIIDKCHDLQGQRSRSQGDVMCLTGTQKMKRPIETPKLVLVGRLPTPQAITSTSFKVKGQRSPDQVMLRPKVRHIFRMERPTNFKLGIQSTDGVRRPISPI